MVCAFCDALGRCRMRRQEVLRARIERGLAGLQLGIALHRGQEARRAIGIEMRVRRDADADAVGLELLVAREARHRQLGLGQRERGEIGVVAHVGDDAGDDRGLPRLVLAHRGVLGQHMRHLVAQHRGQFGGVAGERDQAARDIELAGRQREGVHRAGIEDRDLVGLVGTVGGGDQPVDGLADQRLQLGIVIDAAIGRRGCAHARFSAAGVWARPARLGLGRRRWRAARRSGTGPCRRSRQARAAAHSSSRRSPKAAAHSPSRAVPHTPSTSATRHLGLRRASSRPALRFAPPGAPRSAARRRASTQPRTRIRRFSRDLSAIPAASNAGIMRLEIVTAKSRVQFRPKFR